MAVANEPMTRLQLNFSVENLPSLDLTSKSDPSTFEGSALLPCFLPWPRPWPRDSAVHHGAPLETLLHDAAVLLAPGAPRRR